MKGDEQPRFAPYVGKTAAPLVVEVERGHIRRFAEAIGDPNPIYVDEAAARAAGHPRLPAPPTFAAALRAPDPRADLDIDWRKLLHGEQELLFERPVYAGDRLTLVARIAAASVKQAKAGPLDVMEIETVATDDAGVRVFTARSTVLVRR